MTAQARIAIFSLLLSVGVTPVLAEETKVPYLEATQIARKAQVQPADLQREIVLLNAQARLTPDWVPSYRELIGIDLHLGLLEQARKACQTYLAHQSYNVFAQLQLISVQLEQYQTMEARRQFLDQVLKDSRLLPEVVSEVNRQLAVIAFQNFENDRARKYLEFAIRSFPMNLKAYELGRQISSTDKSATPIQEMSLRTSENMAMVMNNPLHALSALRLASLAGEAKISDAMQTWHSYAEGLRKRFGPQHEWPDMLALELAEAYVAADQPKAAMEILQRLLPKPPTTTPTTTSTQPRPGTAGETRVRMLMILAARQLGDEKMIAEQTQWMDKLAETLKSMSPDIPGRLSIVSIYYSVYAELVERANPVLAVTLAQGAMKSDPNNVNSRYAMALGLAKSGDSAGARKLLKELDEPANPLFLVGQTLCAMNDKQDKEAREILTRAMKITPYGPMREVLLNLANKVGMTDRPEPDMSGIAQMFKKFDPGYLDFPLQYAKACRLIVSAKGDPAKGQTTVLMADLTNKSDVSLGIGPESFIPPFCLIEIEPVPADGRKFVLELPLEARQILAPNKTLNVTGLLDRAMPERGKSTWDEFVANRPAAIKQVVIRAKILSMVTLTESVEVLAAQSEAIKMDLPVVNEDLAEIVVGELKEPQGKDPWSTARLARWILMNDRLAKQHPAVAAGILRQLQTANPAARAAFAWALRFAKPNPDIFNALAQQLKSPDWFVRLMVLDTLGQVQGKAANALFEFYAAKDNDDLVRQLSTGYLLYQY